MKVIKEGKKVEGIMRVTCKTCGAELEIIAGDIKKDPGDLYCNDTYSYKCPCCQRRNYLAYSDLSEEIIFDMTNH